jgi:hypothetical protein
MAAAWSEVCSLNINNWIRTCFLHYGGKTKLLKLAHKPSNIPKKKGPFSSLNKHDNRF